jgi:hypothetical protein
VRCHYTRGSSAALTIGFASNPAFKFTVCEILLLLHCSKLKQSLTPFQTLYAPLQLQAFAVNCCALRQGLKDQN